MFELWYEAMELSSYSMTIFFFFWVFIFIVHNCNRHGDNRRDLFMGSF